MMRLGKTEVLAWVVRAARKIYGVNEVVVATTSSPEDAMIVNWCQSNGTKYFIGSESDVLSRFRLAADFFSADTIIRLTSDCPLIDPEVCSTILSLFKIEGADYASNVSPPNWPDGLDCEVISQKALREADDEAILSLEREHVTPFVRYNRKRYKAVSLSCPIPNLGSERWTLDREEDLQFLNKVTSHLEDNSPPSYLKILDILNDYPGYRDINAGIVRNENFHKEIINTPAASKKGYKNSKKLLSQALKVIPVGTQTFSKSHLQFPKNAPSFISFGEGGRVWDVDGNSYVDLMMGLLPNVLGYQDPNVDRAIIDQLKNGITFSLASELEIILSELIIQSVPSAEMVRFGKNGTDATSAAIRLSRAFTGRDKIMVCGYHGWQDWYIGITDRDKGIPAAIKQLTFPVPYNDIEAVETVLKNNRDQIAALIMEPVNTVEPHPDYFKKLRTILHNHGTLLIFDEIITGFRLAPGGAQEYYNVSPDISCFGKSMGNGMPISAVVGRRDIMNEMENIFFSGTFGGETLSIAASIAVIKKIANEPVISKLWESGSYLFEEVTKIINNNNLSNVIKLTGLSPWKILNFTHNSESVNRQVRTFFMQEMLMAGVLLTASHNVSYAHSHENLVSVIKGYEVVLPKIREALDKENLKSQIYGSIIEPIFTIR